MQKSKSSNAKNFKYNNFFQHVNTHDHNNISAKTMADLKFFQTKDGGLRLAICFLLTLGFLISVLSPGSKANVVFYILISAINVVTSLLVLYRHYSNDLKSEFLKLPWKKAEQFIFFGGAALQVVGCIFWGCVWFFILKIQIWFSESARYKTWQNTHKIIIIK